MKGHEEGAQDEDGAKDMGMGTFCLALMIGILSRAWISKFVKLPYTVIVSARGPMNAQNSRHSGLFPCIFKGHRAFCCRTYKRGHDTCMCVRTHVKLPLCVVLSVRGPIHVFTFRDSGVSLFILCINK